MVGYGHFSPLLVMKTSSTKMVVTMDYSNAQKSINEEKLATINFTVIYSLGGMLLLSCEVRLRNHLAQLALEMATPVNTCQPETEKTNQRFPRAQQNQAKLLLLLILILVYKQTIQHNEGQYHSDVNQVRYIKFHSSVYNPTSTNLLTKFCL